MSDWQTGDLARCVHDKQWSPHGSKRAPDNCSSVVSILFPRVGSEWRVAEVFIMDTPEEGELVYLGLEGQPSSACYDARCFRKILPTADINLASETTPPRESEPA